MVYWLFLKNETFFLVNRLYLLCSVVFALLVPLIKIPLSDSFSNLMSVNILDTIIVSPDNIEQGFFNRLNVFNILTIIYFAGAAIFLIRFLLKLFQIILLINKHEIIHKNGLKIIYLDKNYSPFSFLNFVFLNQDIKREDINSIIIHEKIHVKQYHSLDLIIIEILGIVQWFNPFIWFYRNSLKNLHEYFADEEILLKGFNKTNYKQILIKQTVAFQLNDITNNFNHSLLKRRFIMMSQVKSNKLALLKMFFVLPIAVIMVMAFSLTFTKTIMAQEVEKKPTNSETNVIKADEDIFKVVEQMPGFPGGDKARIKFLIENLKYPEEARKKGIQGRVYVSFVVEKDGSISNIELLRGIGGGCDEEGMRVVSIMPDYEPGLQRGKPVRVRFTLPIKFTLDNKDIKKLPSPPLPEKEEKTEPPPPPK